MLYTHIPQTLVAELKEQFPDSLPTEADYTQHITSEQIAYKAGIQHIIRYLSDCAEICDNTL